MAGFNFGSVFGRESAAYQLFVWQVLASFVGAVGEPGVMALQQLVLSHAPITPLSVADAVDAALKGHLTEAEAEAEALLAGISNERFRVLLASAGSPLAPEELVVAWRRGIIPESGTGAQSVSFEQGVRESRLNPKWTNTLKALAVQQPTPMDVLEALLEGQIDEATARDLYTKFGGDVTYFTMLYNTRGSAPTPIELVDMANRGVIPWEGTGPDATSFQQGMLEGPYRNKWATAYRGAAEWRPTVREISAMVAKGSITDDEARALFAQVGATPAMADQQLRDAHATKTETERDLTVSIIKSLYSDGLIDRQLAQQLLSTLRYSDDSVGFYLALWDFEILQAKVRSAVSRVHNLYVAHKIDATAATKTLQGLSVPASGIQTMLSTWNLERDANVATLTAAQVCDAVYYSIITPEEGLRRLVQLGWPPDEATIRIQIRLHGQAPPTPEA